jgi:hypothetical protein
VRAYRTRETVQEIGDVEALGTVCPSKRKQWKGLRRVLFGPCTLRRGAPVLLIQVAVESTVADKRLRHPTSREKRARCGAPGACCGFHNQALETGCRKVTSSLPGLRADQETYPALRAGLLSTAPCGAVPSLDTRCCGMCVIAGAKSPSIWGCVSARLKSCPDTKPFGWVILGSPFVVFVIAGYPFFRTEFGRRQKRPVSASWRSRRRRALAADGE